MHFRLLFILMFSILSAQTYYQSSVGMEFSSFNARALGIGSVFSDRSAFCLAYNPSNLSMGDNHHFSVIYSYLGNSMLERRSIIVKDSFDDYLTEADYVRNINYDDGSSIGLKYNKENNKPYLF